MLVGSTSKCSDSGKTETLCKKRELLPKGWSILEIVKECQTSFLSQPLQQQLSNEIHVNLIEISVVVKKIRNLLKKGCNR